MIKQITYTIAGLLLSLVLLLGGCTGGNTNSGSDARYTDTATSSLADTIPFSADSAYNFVAAQVAFGPRVPNTVAHSKCKDWLVATLGRFGAAVQVQATRVKVYTGEMVPCYNIIASYNPEATNRVLLCAHWDTRHIADHDPNVADRSMPILGADDGGSGVGVLLELARQYNLRAPNVGVDIVLFDVEDYGTEGDESSWCLGSTYFARNPFRSGYKADFGILLDMVGAKDAKFYWELYSRTNAPAVLSRVWDTAASLGYGRYFIQADGGMLTDDHVPLNKYMGIPTIDIINFSPTNEKGFGHYWHTHSDNMDVIDRNTLQAVGRTVWAVVDGYKSQTN